MFFFFPLNIKVQLKDSEDRLKDSITCLITIPGGKNGENYKGLLQLEKEINPQIESINRIRKDKSIPNT